MSYTANEMEVRGRQPGRGQSGGHDVLRTREVADDDRAKGTRTPVAGYVKGGPAEGMQSCWVTVRERAGPMARGCRKADLFLVPE